MTWPIGFSSLIGCSFLILEEAVNPESAKDSVRYPELSPCERSIVQQAMANHPGPTAERALARLNAAGM
jgi:hypothetical protein